MPKDDDEDDEDEGEDEEHDEDILSSGSGLQNSGLQSQTEAQSKRPKLAITQPPPLQKQMGQQYGFGPLQSQLSQAPSPQPLLQDHLLSDQRSPYLRMGVHGNGMPPMPPSGNSMTGSPNNLMPFNFTGLGSLPNVSGLSGLGLGQLDLSNLGSSGLGSMNLGLTQSPSDFTGLGLNSPFMNSAFSSTNDFKGEPQEGKCDLCKNMAGPDTEHGELITVQCDPPFGCNRIIGRFCESCREGDNDHLGPIYGRYCEVKHSGLCDKCVKQCDCPEPINSGISLPPGLEGDGPFSDPELAQFAASEDGSVLPTGLDPDDPHPAFGDDDDDLGDEGDEDGGEDEGELGDEDELGEFE